MSKFDFLTKFWSNGTKLINSVSLGHGESRKLSDLVFEPLMGSKMWVQFTTQIAMYHNISWLYLHELPIPFDEIFPNYEYIASQSIQLHKSFFWIRGMYIVEWFHEIICSRADPDL